ncbi:MAG: hypothetical protein QGI34_21020 [Candidatus Latescibacteria bacterium]|nr:hypothetical protein [Candidatus Latescibacterota bacterium]
MHPSPSHSVAVDRSLALSKASDDMMRTDETLYTGITSNPIQVAGRFRK